MFVDEAFVRLRAGGGGNGCVSFHREKYVPRGGPDGGDGGRGGNIYLQGDRRLTTLYDLTVHPVFRAEDGTNGGSNKKNGRGGKDLTIRIPVGTLVFAEDDKRGKSPRAAERRGNLPGENPVLLADVLSEAEPLLVARGGRGGGGNTRFSSSKHRLPKFALRGSPGQSLKLCLSLKILSDIAIVGLPNSGKSTLLSALTRAHPKIADYPFTTLTPNLGVLRAEVASIVLADIPGLVKDAHAGKGLGNRFLKHIDRARAILVLLDAAEDVVENFRLLRDEIIRFNPDIWDRPRIVAVNKVDLKKRAPLKTWSGQIKESAVGISAKTGLGIEKLMKSIETLWSRRDMGRDRADPPRTLVLDEAGPQVIRSGDGFIVVSREWEELASMLPKENSEAIQWFVAKLRSDKVFRKLASAGCRAGDQVFVGPVELVFPPTDPNTVQGDSNGES